MKSSLEIFSMITPRAMTQNIGLNKKMDKKARTVATELTINISRMLTPTFPRAKASQKNSIATASKNKAANVLRSDRDNRSFGIFIFPYLQYDGILSILILL